MLFLKVIKLALESLRHEEHFQFMSDVLQILKEAFVNKVGELSSNVNTLFAMFVDLVRREDIAVAHMKKSGITSPIAEADKYRGMLYRGLVLYVQAYEHHAEPNKRDAAKRLQVIIDNYGDARQKTYNEETATIHNLLKDLKEKLPEQVDTIKLSEWIGILEVANNKFKVLMKDRYEENPGTIEDIHIIRNEINSVYRQMASLFEIEAMINPSGLYTKVIEKINERVKYYKNTLAQRKGRADAGDDEDIIEEWE